MMTNAWWRLGPAAELYTGTQWTQGDPAPHQGKQITCERALHCAINRTARNEGERTATVTEGRAHT